jgi:hypothetical protein
VQSTQNAVWLNWQTQKYIRVGFTTAGLVRLNLKVHMNCIDKQPFLDRVLFGSWLCSRSFGDLAQII